MALIHLAVPDTVPGLDVAGAATGGPDGGSRYTYLGPEGTFSEQALLTVAAARRGIRVPARSVPEALDAVRAGEAVAALVPVENSIGGQVGVTLDELVTGPPLVITLEVMLPVQFVLGARPGTGLGDVRSLAAHPQAYAQCRRWLAVNLPEAVVVEVLSNGAAAASVAAGEYDAAVCAPIGAVRYGLADLARDIADRPDAVTRFIFVQRVATPPVPTGDDVTTLAVYIAHDRIGALLAVLTELASRGVNLTRVESRPTGECMGRYAFFLDCAGHVSEARVGEALTGLRRICASVRYLGSYRRGGVDQPVPLPPGVFDGDFAAATTWLARVRAGTAS